ncbi:aminotransferase class I/II-fold pyridoxal phosphate-dependent enzyme [Flavobacterium sp. GA093]|uniref:Aminotransferase class I/II-fold pyridoxal phosphate-dependent enzyme n=1 Tax=Flavobacterium hydrocarbonoxydans TaxID=2683249 RepID=A0A6I4NR33_9FLAO|nr:PLP-dependent aminotransferase family protein [Flavobacterium hydrocarbonoxydans]MWB94159.1 aminotransferase class I/II-fold pyridoxal phosphate-dependent enzyme [Flavobacterium hydrocarbonoxydans]
MKNSSYLYLQFADRIEKQIKSGVLNVGDKLPSIREVCAETGYSMSTVSKAYYEIESRSLIESRPQSGYYVSNISARTISEPSASSPILSSANIEREDLIDLVYGDMRAKDVTMLSLGFPSNELLPIAKLNKGMIQAMRQLPNSGTSYEEIQGNTNLRKEIARWSFTWGGALTEEDIITTPGCITAISHCLMTLTKPGDTIITESPVYFGVLQLAKSLGLYVMELPTNMTTGIELDALKKALSTKKVKACVLMSNFSNPSGSMMPNEHKIEVVRLMEFYNIPLIEDDIHGDLYFGSSRPTNCKTYDESGIVLCCSSVSKSLAPGYRVGWVSPGKFKKEILRTKLYHTISSPTITHEVVGDFLKNGRYENHLRKIRQILNHNCNNYINTVLESFPKGTKVSQPQGGFFLWVELDSKIDTADLYHLAMKHQISIAPGRIFSLQDQFSNCMRLSFGLPWTNELRQSIQTLGKLIS